MFAKTIIWKSRNGSSGLAGPVAMLDLQPTDRAQKQRCRRGNAGTAPRATDGKPDQPAAADTHPPRVSDVNPKSYIIGTEDILTINVWKEPEISEGPGPARRDDLAPPGGRDTATGLTPVQLQDQISQLAEEADGRPAGHGDRQRSAQSDIQRSGAGSEPARILPRSPAG